MQERQGGSKVGQLIASKSQVLTQPYRKLVKRLEELAHESSALKAYLVPQLEALCSIVSEMVNLGIQVRGSTEHSYTFFKLNSFPSLLSKRCLTSTKYALPNLHSNSAESYHLSITLPHRRWQRFARTKRLRGPL